MRLVEQIVVSTLRLASQVHAAIPVPPTEVGAGLSPYHQPDRTAVE